MTRAILLACCALAAAVVLACATAAGRRHAEGGLGLYRSRCASCHRLYAPGDRTRAEWAGVLERMGPRAHLSAEERGAILGYLTASAKDAAPPAPR